MTPNSDGRGNYKISDRLIELLGSSAIDIQYEVDGKIKRQQIRIKDGKNLGYGVAVAALKKALAGDIQAFKEIADRTEGKAAQPVSIATDAVDIRIGFDDVPQDKLNTENKDTENGN